MSHPLKLYEIAEIYDNLMEEVRADAEENDGEISEVLSARLDAMSDVRDDKISNVCKMIKARLRYAEAVKAEVKVLQDRAKSAEREAGYLKSYLAKFIPEGEKFDDGVSKISWRKTSSIKVPEDIDLNEIPEEWYTFETKLLLNEMKKSIKKGESLHGVKHVENISLQLK